MIKKKKYEVAVPFWRNGILLAKGATLWLFPHEAKYLGHALVEQTTPVADKPAERDRASEADDGDAIN